MSSHLKSHMARLRSISILSATLTFSVCFAGPYVDLQRQLARATTPDQVFKIVSDSKEASQQAEIKGDLDSSSDQDADRTAIAQDIRAIVDLASMDEQRTTTKVDQSEAHQIKKSPLYRDKGVDRSRNWFADAIERLKNIHLDKPVEPTGSGANFGIIGQWIVNLVWVLLIGAVLTALFYVIRYLDWRNALTRKTKTLLEEDEPERTLDEWLLLADEHSTSGRYREAVRALYLACLLKFDEHNVARFERGETNWEHLARIQASPNLPNNLDFTEATQRFDRIWYGRQTRGLPDVELFRGWYQEIAASLGGTN